MSKQLLIETQLFNWKQSINEGVKSSVGNPIVEGPLATVEKENGNGRVYSRELWDREINKYQNEISNNSSTGELDHPDSNIISLKNVSHIVREVKWVGDNIVGRIEILPTTSGNILKALIENNVAVGISSRGLGSLKPIGEGKMEVQDDFSLVCWDFVSNPSNKNSWMKLLKENQEPQINKYQNINQIITEILCNNGSCPIL